MFLPTMLSMAGHSAIVTRRRRLRSAIQIGHIARSAYASRVTANNMLSVTAKESPSMAESIALASAPSRNAPYSPMPLFAARVAHGVNGVFEDGASKRGGEGDDSEGCQEIGGHR